ncbi:hypothetical protein BKA04_001306 [Cryobacterium mesophilum]|uniref:Lipase (Class 3) n=1 Tax=Terrimesophilobacter mesophilus TaxID=433647 RepID=A0A4R8V9I5_9MICO|nr:hypothetical protein [Terrimesophilobacter mesophilus]MBB5633083.1 hypothetical protein [Terrimesophilobacter mesophilus]TFB79841.1 hypothetical protein E3N84_07170 [Terrimesophilobacter mesophilus]
MSDDLAVGGPGTTSVLTTELRDEAGYVALLGIELDACRSGLVWLDRIIGNGILGAADAPLSALQAEEAIDDAVRALAAAREDADRLAMGLRGAAGGYELADRVVDGLGQQLAATLGYFVGSIAPLLAAVFLPGAVIAGAGVAAFLATLPQGSRDAVFGMAGGWLRSNSSALSDPAFVTAVRYGVMSADDAGAGMLHLPPQVAQLLGDEGLGILGVDTSAAVVAGGLAGLGLARESAVAVRPSATQEVRGADGIRDRIERIPAEPEQIRIDRYSTPGQADRFEVYVAGTAELALDGDANPWDMTSNLAAMAGGSDGSGAGSYRAVVAAMASAGIDSTSPVTLTGYSQGGLIAAQLAASGQYSIEGLVTVGAPAGQVEVPHDIPYLAIEHTNDLVPALGGTFASSEPLVVRRQLFDGPPPETSVMLPAHQLSNYIETAGIVDRSTNLRIADLLARLGQPHAGSVSSTIYLAQRLDR